MVGDDEAQRVAALAAYDVFDTVSEARFDDLAEIAANLCGAPMGAIAFVDGSRVWLKAAFGAAWAKVPREGLYGKAFAPLADGPLVADDALNDARFSGEAVVRRAPFVRAFAAVPLHSPGGAFLGSLFVADRLPRAFTTDHIETLVRLSALVVDVLELRRLRLGMTPAGASSGAEGERRRLRALEAEIEQRKRAEERLTFAAYHDELTRLANRAFLERRLDAIIAAARGDATHRATVLFIDLDRFKRINDRLGHVTGDLLLTLVARRLERSVRPGDVVARLGGDEFMVVLDGIGDTDVAFDLAKRIAGALAAPYRLQRTETYVTVSIGVAAIDENTASMSEVLREADIAMYRAKEMGRNRVAVFQPYLRERDVAIATLESDLRIAWEHRQFFLAYQPIVSLETNSLVGFEALLRWRHPTRGTVYPSDFIAATEEIGMIVPLGEWIITEACRQLFFWQGERGDAAPLTMSVNLSGMQLGSPELVDHVDRVMKISEIVPGTFTIELTESVILEDFTIAADVLGRLRSLGVNIHMDDFGTGFSSLNYLRQLPIDRLKIDRVFVSGKDGQLADAEIVDTIVSLAHKLGIAAIAEGVETEAQRAALARLGCDAAQGFLYAPAVSPPQAGEMLWALEPGGAERLRRRTAALASS